MSEVNVEYRLEIEPWPEWLTHTVTIEPSQFLRCKHNMVIFMGSWGTSILSCSNVIYHHHLSNDVAMRLGMTCDDVFAQVGVTQVFIWHIQSLYHRHYSPNTPIICRSPSSTGVNTLFWKITFFLASTVQSVAFAQYVKTWFLKSVET